MRSSQALHALTPLLTRWASLELICSKILSNEQSGEAGSSGTTFLSKDYNPITIHHLLMEIQTVSQFLVVNIDIHWCLLETGDWAALHDGIFYTQCSSRAWPYCIHHQSMDVSLLGCFSWLKAKAMASFLHDCRLTSCHTSLLMDWSVFRAEVAFPPAATDVYNFY